VAGFYAARAGTILALPWPSFALPLSDANSLVAGNQAFTLDNGGAFLAGEVRQTVYGSNVLLEANVDGDATAEMSILLINTGVLGIGDFVL
jgi:hypothetical protein